jgi:Protein of unknown function (DUF3025)
VNPRAGDAFWRAIDWRAPWLAPYAERGGALVAQLEAGATVAAALNAHAPAIALANGPLVFVPHAALPAEEGYEAFIHRTGGVPTRDNLHDFFNGLVWLHWPALKCWLNQAQAQAMQSPAAAGMRGAQRDALTLFDENALLWPAPAPLVAALERSDWPALFVAGRSAWAGHVPWLFGHALMEKLVQPYKAITAHCWVMPAGHTPLDWRPPTPLARSWRPLPVLGVPGWWPANESEGFYADAAVFRPRRR